MAAAQVLVHTSRKVDSLDGGARAEASGFVIPTDCEATRVFHGHAVCIYRGRVRYGSGNGANRKSCRRVVHSGGRRRDFRPLQQPFSNPTRLGGRGRSGRFFCYFRDDYLEHKETHIEKIITGPFLWFH